MGECLITRRGGEAYELPILNSAYPQDVSIVESANGSASFSVQIDTPGKPAEYTFQWYLNGEAISGATNSTYTKTDLTSVAAYTLQCKVTNKAGFVMSRTATLTVQSSMPEYTYTGSHSLEKDGTYGWKLTLKTSGKLIFTRLGSGASGVDAFLSGAGGGGTLRAGGGGGYTQTLLGVSVQLNYERGITIGSGGKGFPGAGGTATSSTNGGNTGALGAVANGGKTGTYNAKGGDGGTGGSGAADNLAGSSDGADGKGSNPGIGQHTTTREFGEAAGKLYSNGGGTAAFSQPGTSGAANTGNGGQGSGAVNSGPAPAAGDGGSGIVIIRNRRN